MRITYLLAAGAASLTFAAAAASPAAAPVVLGILGGLALIKNVNSMPITTPHPSKPCLKEVYDLSSQECVMINRCASAQRLRWTLTGEEKYIASGRQAKCFTINSSAHKELMAPFDEDSIKIINLRDEL